MCLSIIRSKLRPLLLAWLLSTDAAMHVAVGQEFVAPEAASPEIAAPEIASPEIAADDLEFFEAKIRPVIVEHCYECHSAEAAAKNKLRGGLLLDSRDAITTGGDSGPAALPGDTESSLLLQALRYESFEMPPTGQLPDDVIDDFERWIASGLADPRGTASNMTPSSNSIDVNSARHHWAYRPLQKPVTRHSPVHGAKCQSDIVASPVDEMIFDKLKSKHVRPNVGASREVLIRRLYFDLLGLPPTSEQIRSFVGDRSPDAYERLVDRLLGSPHFGQRWGRHWLDVVRFAESITLRGTLMPETWRYRDYVIEHFNADRSLPQFIREQLAGDLLPADDWRDRRRHLIATVFLTLGNNNLEDQDKQKLRMDVVDEQLQVIGRGFLAQTIGCARCHDHKFDPIPTSDYYALAGILQNTRTLVDANVSEWIKTPLPVDPKLNLLGTAAPSQPMIVTVKESETLEVARIRVRGEVHNLGREVPRGFLRVLMLDDSPTFSEAQSGRLELAEWLASNENPLPARVFANRIWHWLFGAGLVRTTDNFGTMGEQPSHPELLDYLAMRLHRSGGSTKSLVREIVLTEAYRRSSEVDDEHGAHAASIDPENRLLWRGSRRRLEAECVLDAMLSVSGSLQDQMGGTTIREDTKTDYDYEHGVLPRRAVYWPVLRNSLPQLFDVFDFANPSMVVGQRNQSSTPPQSLFMMNNPLVIELAERTATRLLNDPDSSNRDRMNQLFWQTIGRAPTDSECETVAQYLQDVDRTDPLQWHAAWAQVVQAMFASLDFRYLD
jgi:hypothetical protein